MLHPRRGGRDVNARPTDLWVSDYIYFEGLREAVKCYVLHALPLMCDGGWESRSVDGGKGIGLLVLLSLLVPSQWTVSKVYGFDGVGI